MKEKDNKGEQLEKLSNELFGAFDPQDEAWLVGGSKTITMGQTASAEPTNSDIWVDLDFPEFNTNV